MFGICFFFMVTNISLVIHVLRVAFSVSVSSLLAAAAAAVLVYWYNSCNISGAFIFVNKLEYFTFINYIFFLYVSCESLLACDFSHSLFFCSKSSTNDKTSLINYLRISKKLSITSYLPCVYAAFIFIVSVSIYLSKSSSFANNSLNICWFDPDFSNVSIALIALKFPNSAFWTDVPALSSAEFNLSRNFLNFAFISLLSFG